MTSSTASIGNILTASSLLLVVVVEFAGLARDGIEQPSDLLGYRGDCHILPGLGYFSTLHTINFIILGVAFALVSSTVMREASSIVGPLETSVGLVVVLVWLALPLLEVGQYSDIREAGLRPLSLVWHVFVTIFLIIVSISSGYRIFGLLAFPKEISMVISANIHVAQVIGFCIIIVSFSAGMIGFLKLLEWEIEEIARRSNAEIEMDKHRDRPVVSEDSRIVVYWPKCAGAEYMGEDRL
jgi:hypothetical protein